MSPADRAVVELALARGWLNPTSLQAAQAAAGGGPLLPALRPHLPPQALGQLRTLHERVQRGEAAPSSAETVVDPAASSSDMGPSLPPGDKRVGPYRIERELARGGMGVVYVARDAGGRRVALKLLGRHLNAGHVLERFQTEAEVTARFNHPNVVGIHDCGSELGQPWYAMQLVEGQSLGDRISREGPLPIPEAVELCRVLAEALQHVHDQGVLHRDLKPANVLLAAPDGRPVITDFGVARRAYAEQRLTQTGDLVGTAAYMPPEQASGELDRLGPTSDLYALGATLYAALTASPPFGERQHIQALRAVLQDEPPPPSACRGEIDPDLDAIVLRCLAKDPAQRYASGEALASELARYLAGEEISARRPTAGERLARRLRRHRVALGAAGALCALGVAGAGLLVWQSGRTREEDRRQREQLVDEVAEERRSEAQAQEIATQLGQLDGYAADNEATRKRVARREQTLSELKAEIERKVAKISGKLAERTRASLVVQSQPVRSELLYDMEQALSALVVRYGQLQALPSEHERVRARRAEVLAETAQLAARARVLAGATWEYAADHSRPSDALTRYQRALAALDRKASELPAETPPLSRRRGSVLLSLARLAQGRPKAVRLPLVLESGGPKRSFQSRLDFAKEALKRALEQLDQTCAASERDWGAHLERVAIRRAMATHGVQGEGTVWAELQRANMAELEGLAKRLRAELAAAEGDEAHQELEEWLFKALTGLQRASFNLQLDERCLEFCREHLELVRTRVSRGRGHHAPGVDRAHRYAAQSLLRRQRYAEALEHFNKFAAIESADERDDYCEAKLGAAHCSSLLGRLDAAQAHLDDVKRVLERVKLTKKTRAWLVRELVCEQLIVAGKGGASHAAAVRRALAAIPAGTHLQGEGAEEPDFLRRAAQAVWGKGRRHLAQEVFAQILLSLASDPGWGAADVVKNALEALPPDLRSKQRLQGVIVAGARAEIEARHGFKRMQAITQVMRGLPD